MESKPSLTEKDLLNNLNNIKDEWSFHITEDHGGVIPTACHQCGRLKQQMIYAEEDLAELSPKG